MNKSDFEKFLNKAKAISEDYTTTTAESDDPDMLWFTPSQLKKYTAYCLSEKQLNNHQKQ